MMVTLQDIQAARERIRSALRPTPCPASDYFTEKTDCAVVYFKLENLQRTGAFKERGALNKLLTLTTKRSARGVIAASRRQPRAGRGVPRARGWASRPPS